MTSELCEKAARIWRQPRMSGEAGGTAEAGKQEVAAVNIYIWVRNKSVTDPSDVSR